jgi:hypothetical protein
VRLPRNKGPWGGLSCSVNWIISNQARDIKFRGCKATLDLISESELPFRFQAESGASSLVVLTDGSQPLFMLPIEYHVTCAVMALCFFPRKPHLFTIFGYD